MLKGTFPLERFAGLQTPFYYYDTGLLQKTLDCVLEQVADRPSWQVHYAVKANHNPVILKQIAGAGLGADCVSGGEIQAALDAGFPPGSVVFAGVGKTDREIELGLEAGIGRFNVESAAELRVIAEIAAARGCIAPVSLRVNPDIGAHTLAGITTGMAENKFGIYHGAVAEVIKEALDTPSVSYRGLHFHIGSQILDMSDFAALCNRINDLCARLERMGIPVGDINVGGGLGIEYGHPNHLPIADFAAYFGTFKELLPEGYAVHFELGRSIVAPCGTLISRVLYVKEGVARRFAILDAGMNDLVRPAMYHASHRIENLSSDGPELPYDVVGPVCESSDVFGKGVVLNECRRRDIIAIRSAGAYGESMASRYNCRPFAPSVFPTESL
ncbi:MAG: diaminopimelate decarboxylase [Bacteroidales bacterium]|nr:diaminopimelate decarboxylase [Bacteroidales bacterium]